MTTDPRNRAPPPSAGTGTTGMEDDDDDDDDNSNNNDPTNNNNILLSHHQDDDVMDVDEDVVTTAAAAAPLTPLTLSDHAAGQQQQQNLQQLFPTRIITPSPFPQHNAINSRFRNALVRVTAHPWHDTEAWQAVLTEVQTCYRNTIAPQVLVFSAASTTTTTTTTTSTDGDTTTAATATTSVTDLLLQLDWVESCYGCVLHHFPYAVPHIVQLAQVLLAQCGGGWSRSRSRILLAQRAAVANTKLTHLLRQHLGVYPLSSSPSTTTTTSTATAKDEGDNPNHDTQKDPDNNNLPLCSWSVDLWLLYIEKVQQVDAPATTTTSDQRRQAVIDAYEHAVSVAGAVHHDNYKLWQSYLQFVSSSTTEWDSVQKQKLQLRSIYQRCWTHPMANLDALWQAYEILEKQQSEALAASLLQEYLPQYQHARTVHLEASRVVASPEQLQLGRLATPPVGEEPPEEATSITTSTTSTTATTTTTTAAAAVTTATTTTTAKESGSGTTSAGGTTDDANVWMLRGEEHQLLEAWKIRCAYERTNPARRPPAEWAARVRHAYREMACTLTRHAEVWHMWSAWELLVPSSSSSTTTLSSNDPPSHSTTTTQLPAPAQRAIQILQLGQRHIPDSTLLAWTEATLMERYSHPQQSLQVMQRLVQRRPSTLAYVLLQQLVRRHCGMAPARAVFTAARRVLTTTTAAATAAGVTGSTPTTTTLESSSSTVISNNEGSSSSIGERTGGGAEGIGNTGGGGATTLDPVENGGGRRSRQYWMVTNRLDASIGARKNATSRTKTMVSGGEALDPSSAAAGVVVAGPITWHLFAAHAGMEHRINRAPEVAARVYELGLRHHASFITVPAYVQRYAQLLLELNDKANLRALLTRAVAACGGQQPPQQRGGSSSRSKENLAALWDLTLQYEAILGADDPSRATTLWEMERKRREVVQGPDIEDVATGGLVGAQGDASALIGAQKITIAEQLIRTEGYDVSSRIVNGMSRTVDVLGLLGFWGSGESPVSRSRSRAIKEDALEFSGSKSDISFQKRLHFQQVTQAGISHDVAVVAEGGTGSKILSARERLAGGTGGPSGSTGAGGGGTAVMLAIQQSPDWLRPLLLLLPASRLRLPLVAKPPPHLTEMALQRLRQNDLPAERPPDDVPKRSKRSRATDGNSSDEDDSGVHSGSSGYGNTFRARQRARIMQQNGN